MIIDCHGHYTTAPKGLQVWRDSQLLALKDTARTPAKGRHGPNLITAWTPVVDLLPVGRKIVHKLVPFVIRKLKRLTTRGEHEENLIDAAHGGGKRHGMAIGR